MKNPDPKSDYTMEFYKTKGKKFKEPVVIGKRKEKELEDDKFTDKIFTGDNPKLTALLSGEVREREIMFNTDMKRKRTILSEDKQSGINTVHKRKEDIHADVDQET